jgi:hypothetical protein
LICRKSAAGFPHGEKDRRLNTKNAPAGMSRGVFDVCEDASVYASVYASLEPE